MNHRALRFAESFSSVTVLLPKQSEVLSGEILLSSPDLLPSPHVSCIHVIFSWTQIGKLGLQIGRLGLK